ncbi:hypothetical protein N7468_007266 [Penicillium chermesinum]|uniref:DUF726 domain-containing protein n=1 Tax=Penicillium chermesinum TaxID=63820 RepID=A0A9W9TKE2_9EURO|nr:uncharacterized protein N7468_007266 [Penicillium chermesinum]KAJ5226041.1 hypothetical protein N7468_007266 [Penicillium chermesinum]
MLKNLKDKRASLFDSKGSKEGPSASDRDQDLTSILDRSQRADLTVLVAEIAESMRTGLIDVFENSNEFPTDNSPIANSPSNEDPKEDSKEDSQKERDDATPSLPPRPQNDTPRESSDKLVKEKKSPEPAKVDPRKEAIKAQAKKDSLAHLDDWRDAVLLRIGQVVNKDNDDDDKAQDKDAIPDAAKQDDLPLGEDREDKKRMEKLRQVYRPIESPLVHLPKATRLLILHSLLLLLLSLEHYNAYSRILMLRVASSLDIDVKILNEDEVKVARGLLDNALALSGAPEDQQKPKKRDDSRKWKVGIASVAGAALIGITGGLAAPLVAAGIGSIMGGLGLGATAAAGYLGALAGSGVVVGGLFGAYGGRMTGRMMDKYAREVEDFAFIPIRGSRKRIQKESDAAREDHRLRVTIGVTGWLKEESNFVIPWRVIGADSEVFGLRWETKSLMTLGNAISSLVTSAAWSVAGKQVLSRTFFATIMSAVMLPMGLMKVARIVDNPFSVAKARADKAGEVLADALINKVQGERSVTLIGYSLGSRLIFSCLQSLARRGAWGLVESVILLGSPAPSDAEHWRNIRSVVSGRVVNVFSKNDAVLAFLYRTSSLQLGVAGLQRVEGVPGVENVDVSEMISGHLRYQFLLGKIISSIGLQDIDNGEAQREEAALELEDKRQEEQRLRNEQDAGVQDRDSSAAREILNSQDGFKEETRMEKQVQTDTEEHLSHRTQQMDIGDQDHASPLDDRSGKYSAL